MFHENDWKLQESNLVFLVMSQPLDHHHGPEFCSDVKVFIFSYSVTVVHFEKIRFKRSKVRKSGDRTFFDSELMERQRR